MPARWLLYALVLLASAWDVLLVGAEVKCWSVETQAGSGLGAPCPGYQYRGKICSEQEARVTFMASILGGILDRYLTIEACQRALSDLCTEISPNAAAKPGSTCENSCEVLQSGAMTSCNEDADCVGAETSLDADELLAGVDVFIDAAYANMCCSYVESMARLGCVGFTDAEMVAYMDKATDQKCSTKPTCLYPSNFISRGSRLGAPGVPLAALVAAATALAARALL